LAILIRFFGLITPKILIIWLSNLTPETRRVHQI
jgi:hypothetical protein